jgi:MFS family permease
LLGIALLFGTPFFVVFGWLSDKIGRKSIMMFGMLLAILLYRPIYKTMYETVNVAHKELVSKKLITEGNNVITYKVYADKTEVKEVQNQTDLTIKTQMTISNHDRWMLVFLVFIQVIFVTMVYGPIAAFLVEMFPTKIRYTSMSLPYHVGNGIFGGLLPAISTYFVTNAKTNGNPEYYLEGLWYPIIIASVCFVIGMIYLSWKNETTND